MTICRICGNDRANQDYVAREMMFGLREQFGYFQCGRCGCLQISEYPGDMARHYPDNYYSFAPPSDPGEQSEAKRFLKARRLDHWLGQRTALGWLAASAFGQPGIDDPVLLELRDAAPLSSKTSVLDVGCGKGERLMQWSSYGFLDLQGYDPFVAADIRYRNGVTVFKSLPANGRGYRLVTMHHSFEHMAEPQRVLETIAGKLASDHLVMISVPLCSSLAWEKYGVDWVQLDAPRHFFLHTAESMSILVEAAGFRVDRVIYNSTSFQFWGSEQYRRDIPLTDPRSRTRNPASDLFSAAEMAAFEAEAARLNQLGRGDQASFYLTRRH